MGIAPRLISFKANFSIDALKRKIVLPKVDKELKSEVNNKSRIRSSFSGDVSCASL